MLEKNVLHKLPAKIKWYRLTYLISISALISFPFALAGHFFVFFRMLLVFFVLPIFFFKAWADSNVSFAFDDLKLTINSGIISRENKIIPYDKVQNVKIKSGPITSMFGLSHISIWTASPDQASRGKEDAKPDGFLTLTHEDGQTLSESILKKA